MASRPTRLIAESTARVRRVAHRVEAPGQPHSPDRTAAAARRTGAFPVMALALASLLSAAACGGSPSLKTTHTPPPAVESAASHLGGSPIASASAPLHVPADSVDTVDRRLGVTIDGQTTYLKNGGQIVLGGGLAVELYLDPYPPAVLRSTMDVYVTRGGDPLTDGGVEIEYDMLAMAHGPFSAEAKKIGEGHYLVALDYIMFGPWEQIVTLRIGLQRIRLPVVVVAYP